MESDTDISYATADSVRSPGSSPLSSTGASLIDSNYLKHRFHPDVVRTLENLFISPLTQFFDRPKKNFRGQLIKIFFETFSERTFPKSFSVFQNWIECIHSGSLIIDDIQDGSEVRRGQKALHLIEGIGPAINLGNYLYFVPLYQLCCQIQELSEHQKLEIVKAYAEALSQAHLGQMLDLRINMADYPISLWKEFSLTTMELKTGAITALAIRMALILGNISSNFQKPIIEYGIRFGIALQMFDDIGNALGTKEPEKAKEDLKHQKPNWFLALLSEEKESVQTTFFTAWKYLPEIKPLTDWVSEHAESVTRFKQKTSQFLKGARDTLERDLYHIEPTRKWNLTPLDALERKLQEAYYG